MPTYTLKVDGTTRNMTTDRMRLLSLTVAYDGPRALTFQQDYAPHFSPTYGEHESVELQVDGTTWFLGEITRIQCEGDQPERITYTALGLRYKAAQVDLLDSSPAIPRYVYNAKQGDTDYSTSRDRMSVGQILKEWLDNNVASLRAVGCAPAASDPYVQAELDLLTVVPPGKLVFENAKFAEAVADLLQHQPYVVFHIDPDTKIWHFKRIEDLSASTITFQSDEVFDDMIESSTEGCRTAYQIYGELQQTLRWAYLSKGDLAAGWNAAKETDWDLSKAMAVAYDESGNPTDQGSDYIINAGASWTPNAFDGLTVWLSDGVDDEAVEIASNTATRINLVADHGLGTITSYEVKGGNTDYRYVWSRYQVTDATKRRMARWNRRGAPFIGGVPGQKITTSNAIFHPVVYAVYTVRNSDGEDRDVWMMVPVAFDHEEGTFLTHTPLASFGPEKSPLKAGDATAPKDVLLIYEHVQTNLSARAPASGHTGTAYSEAGVEETETVYVSEWQDEAEQGDYDTLAAERIKALKDIRYRGSVPIVGTQSAYVNLGRVMNIGAVDSDGVPVATGWESINALLRSVTYDWQNEYGGKTTLEINSDMRGYAGVRPVRTREPTKPHLVTTIGPGGRVTAKRWGEARREWVATPVVHERVRDTRGQEDPVTRLCYPEIEQAEPERPEEPHHALPTEELPNLDVSEV